MRPALGLETIAQTDEAHWQAMDDSDVLGTMRMTRALLPKHVASGDGIVVTIGSVAAFEPCAGGRGVQRGQAGHKGRDGRAADGADRPAGSRE